MVWKPQTEKNSQARPQASGTVELEFCFLSCGDLVWDGLIEVILYILTESFYGAISGVRDCWKI